MTKTTKLITNRLIIREFVHSEADMAALYEIMSDAKANKYLPWFTMKNKDEALAFFQNRIRPKYESKQGYYFAVCLKNNDKPIGYITVSGDASCDFGYGLRQEYWGIGIITEACQKVLSFLKEQGWIYVTATHDVNNVNSGKVLQKIGMTYKYIFKEQWKPKNILVLFRMYQLNFDGEDRVYRGYWNKYEEHLIEPSENF